MARGQVVRDRRVSRNRYGHKYRKWVWCVQRGDCCLVGCKFDRPPYKPIELTPMEAQIMAALMLCEVGAVELPALTLFVYPDPERVPETFRNVLEVTLSRLRVRVRHTGVKIKNWGYGRGWELVVA